MPTMFAAGSALLQILQFGGDRAERRADIGADHDKGGDCRYGDQCGNQRILDRGDPGLVFDQARKDPAQRNPPCFKESNRA